MSPRKTEKTPTQLFLNNVDKLLNHYITQGKSVEETFKFAASIHPDLGLPSDQFEILLKTAHAAWLASEKNQRELLKSLKDENHALSLELDIIKKSLDKVIVSKEKSSVETNNTIRDLKIAKKHAERLSLALNRLTSILLNSKKLPPDLEKIVKEYSSGFELSQGVMGFKEPQKKLHLAGWNLQLSSEGYYRAFRSVKRKNVGVHIGRKIDIEQALKKIQEKEAELGLEPLKVTKKSDLAYNIIKKK